MTLQPLDVPEQRPAFPGRIEVITQPLFTESLHSFFVVDAGPVYEAETADRQANLYS